MWNPEQLAQWQATNDGPLSRLSPDEVFSEAAFVHQYKSLHELIWARIIRLHGTIRTLEQLAPFPFDYLYGPNDMEFWRLVFENFADAAIILVHGLVTDRGPDVCGLRHFRNLIVRAKWADDRLLERFKKTLGDRGFDRHVESIKSRVTRIRMHVAHPLLKTFGDHEGIAVTLTELRRLSNAVHRQFGALCIGSTYVTLCGDFLPGTVGGKALPTSVDEVLDAITRSSSVVAHPEQPWWPLIRQYRSEEEIRVLNQLRTRIDLPEA